MLAVHRKPLSAKTKPGLSPRGPASCSSLSSQAISNRGVFLVGSRNHPDSRRAFKLRTGRNPPMGRRGLGSRRSGIGGSRIRRSAASGLSRSATATLGRGTAAAATAIAETTEQLELTAAGATTARLRSTAAGLSGAARLGSAGRLFDHFFRTARRLFSGTAGFFGRTAAATTVTTEQLKTGAGFALHGNHRTDQSHHSNGGLHCKTLTHRKSSN
jgi:hypothetical protein